MYINSFDLNRNIGRLAKASLVSIGILLFILVAIFYWLGANFNHL